MNMCSRVRWTFLAVSPNCVYLLLDIRRYYPAFKASILRNAFSQYGCIGPFLLRYGYRDGFEMVDRVSRCRPETHEHVICRLFRTSDILHIAKIDRLPSWFPQHNFQTSSAFQEAPFRRCIHDRDGNFPEGPEIGLLRDTAIWGEYP